jgi:transcriptional regulator with XRE-family HTH domain
MSRTISSKDRRENGKPPRLAENIKRLRKEKGWSQGELGEKIGCHLSHVNRIETGKYTPSLETVINIARAFEVPLDYLVNSADGSLEEVRIEDQTLANRIKLLNTLDDKEREVVTQVIDALLTKRKMLEVLTKASER